MWATLLSVFTTVFLAEIGDKTQLATLLFAADRRASRWVVFAGASLALTTAAGIGVLVGAEVDRFVSRSMLRTAAGLGFIAIGLWTLLAR
jgi:putative Ca2+/H+ antiporter (TMEM165/GDT1 family)